MQLSRHLIIQNIQRFSAPFLYKSHEERSKKECVAVLIGLYKKNGAASCEQIRFLANIDKNCNTFFKTSVTPDSDRHMKMISLDQY